MKITVTIDRNCCHPTEDLKPYKGSITEGLKNLKRLSFCTYCGQLWCWNRAAGELDGGMEKVNILTCEP